MYSKAPCRGSVESDHERTCGPVALVNHQAHHLVVGADACRQQGEDRREDEAKPEPSLPTGGSYRWMAAAALEVEVAAVAAATSNRCCPAPPGVAGSFQ